MTIPEAAGLILQSALLAEGGETFLLEMGAPVKIEDLARQMIELAGFVPGRDIDIRYTGLRPGEKLHEETVSPAETTVCTRHPQIKRVAGAIGTAFDGMRAAALWQALAAGQNETARHHLLQAATD